MRFNSYSLRDGASFAEQARNVAFDLTGDDGAAQERQRREMKWDKKKKRFVKGTGEGADNVKLVKTESGVKLPVSFRSGRFDEWKAKSRMSLPKVGEAEPEGARSGGAIVIHRPVRTRWVTASAITLAAATPTNPQKANA